MQATLNARANIRGLQNFVGSMTSLVEDMRRFTNAKLHDYLKDGEKWRTTMADTFVESSVHCLVWC